ncbi:MAG: hypothetical protein MJA27_21355, partial [Pseudanabaenales cyanobacterium]|nr:hypothetical protein [Pseudanabaenales cyanobacterium]
HRIESSNEITSNKCHGSTLTDVRCFHVVSHAMGKDFHPPKVDRQSTSLTSDEAGFARDEVSLT